MLDIIGIAKFLPKTMAFRSPANCMYYVLVPYVLVVAVHGVVAVAVHVVSPVLAQYY